jgi:hypothetical protein
VALNAWENRTLRAITYELSRSAPEFASSLSVFNRLASGESLPEHVPARWCGQHGRHRRSPRGARDGRDCRTQPARARPGGVLLFAAVLTATAVAIVLAVVLAGVGQTPARTKEGPASCPMAVPSTCVGQYASP